MSFEVEQLGLEELDKDKRRVHLWQSHEARVVVDAPAMLEQVRKLQAAIAGSQVNLLLVQTEIPRKSHNA
jgi:hypothetical protein